MQKSIADQRAPQTSAPDSWDSLSLTIRARLEREGLNSPEQWRAAGKRRHLIFGVVPAMVAQLDALARGAP